MKIRLLILFTVQLLICGLFSAIAWAGTETQWHGFINQAFINTSDNQFFGDSKSGSTEFTELGLNVSRRLTSKLQLSAQLLSREAGKTDDGSLRIDYALVNYEFYNNDNSNWGIRAGRIKNPYGFYNETRDVAHTRPSILLPQSQYQDRARTLLMASDSLVLYSNFFNDQSEFSFIALAGYPLAGGEELETAYFWADWGGDLKGELTYIIQMEYSLNGGQNRFILNLADINFSFSRDPDFLFPITTPPFALTDPGNGKANYKPILIGYQHQAENWHLTTEYAQFDIETEEYSIATNPLFPDSKYTSEAFYLQLGYLINDSWEILLRRDEFYQDRSDRNGNKTAAALVALPPPFGPLPPHKFYSQDNTLTLRWTVNPNFLLQAEYHNIEGTFWLPALDNPDTLLTKKNWDMFILSASYRF